MVLRNRQKVSAGVYVSLRAQTFFCRLVTLTGTILPKGVVPRINGYPSKRISEASADFLHLGDDEIITGGTSVFCATGESTPPNI